MDYSVFRTTQNKKGLCKLIEQLNEQATGWSEGLIVRKETRKGKTASGKYRIEVPQGGLPNEVVLLRVYEGDIITKEAEGYIESQLRQHKIPFKKYVNISIQEPNGKNPIPIIGSEPELIYQPQKV